MSRRAPVVGLTYSQWFFNLPRSDEKTYELQSLKRKTKQRSIKDVKFEIRRTDSPIKPETLAISGNNEKYDSQRPADSLRLQRIFDAVFKKFVNPKLDLMASLEQIKGMEATKREEVLKTLGGFLNFESRSRVPALPATSSSSHESKRLAPDELSIGWTGQPTVKRITCNVETSSPRGIDYAFLAFPEFKEDLDKRSPPPLKPPLVRPRKARGKSNNRNRRRKKTSPETSPTPEFSKVHTNENNVVIFKDAVHNSSVAQRHIRTLRDEQHCKEHLLETENVNLKSIASEDLANNTNVSLKKLSLDKHSIAQELNSPLESLQDGEDLKYKTVQEPSSTLGRKSKGGIAQDTVSDFESSKQKKLDLDPDIPRSEVENIDVNKGQVPTSSSERISNKQTIDSACNMELERAVGEKRKHVCTGDKIKQTDDYLYNVHNHPSGIDLNKRDLDVDKRSTSASKSNALRLKTAKSSRSMAKDIKSSEFNIPKQLIENAPGNVSIKGPGNTSLEQGNETLRKERAFKDIEEPPEKNVFVSIETNDYSSYKRDKNDYNYSPSNNKVRTIRGGLSQDGNEINEDRGNKKLLNSKLQNKTILGDETLNGKKENTTRNTKSESSLRSERKVIEAKRQFSKSSLRKLKTNKISIQANYMKHIRHKAWFKNPNRNNGVKDKSNGYKGPHNKINLPKLVKMPENVRDVISKSVRFKAGNYTPRSKHFLRETFPSAVSLKGTKRKVLKVSASKHSMDLHDDKNVGSSKNNAIKHGVFFPSKKASQENVLPSSLNPRRPRTALVVKRTKRTKVISNSNISLPSLPNLLKRSVSFKDAPKPSWGKEQNKLTGYANNVNLNKSIMSRFNKGSSTALAQNTSHMKLNNHKYLSDPKQTYVEKKKPVVQSKHVGKKIKNITLNESKVGQGKTANPTSFNRNPRKVRRLHSIKPKPEPIVLKMYGRGRRNASVNNPASDIHTLKSVQIIKSEKQLKHTTKNRVPSQTSHLKHKSVNRTNSTIVKNGSVPVINLHVRRFSTLRNNSSKIQEQCNKSVSTITSRSTPLISNDGPYKGQKNKQSSVTNLRTKVIRSTDIGMPTVQNNPSMKKEYLPQRSWITIKNGVYAKQPHQNLTTVLAPSEGGKKLKRKHPRKSLKSKAKSTQTLAFKNERVGSSSTTDISPRNKEIKVEVLYNRQCYNSNTKLKRDDSETNVHIALTNNNNMSPSKLELERPAHPTQVKNCNAIPSQMVRNVVGKCVNRARLGSLTVLVPPSAENLDRQTPRRWKCKADRLIKLKLYKKENKLVQSLNYQLAKTSNIRNNTVQSNERLAQLAPYKSVNSVNLDQLNKDVERLRTNIDKYKFPRLSKKYNTKSLFSTTHKEPIIDNLGGYTKNNTPGEIQDIRKGASNKIDQINDSNANITKEGVKSHGKQNHTLCSAGRKINVDLLNLDELSKSQRSKSVPGKVLQSTADKTVNKIESSGNHVGSKGCNNRRTKLNVDGTRASRKDKLTLDCHMDTIVSKLLSQAKNANAPKTKSVLGSNEMKTQPGTIKLLMQETKELEKTMKCYKHETHTADKPSNLARSVNNDNNSSKIAGGKISNLESGVKNMHSTVANCKNQLSEINNLVGTKIKSRNAKNNNEDMSIKLKKQLAQLGQMITVNRKKKELIHTESFQVSSSNKKDNPTKMTKHPRETVKTTPTHNKLIHELQVSKSDGQINNTHSKLTSKINTIDANNEVLKHERDERLNKSRNSSKMHEESLGLSNDNNKNTLHEGLLRAIQIMKNASPVHEQNYSIEEKRPTNIKKDNFNKVGTKINSETPKFTKETLKCAENSTISTPKHTMQQAKVHEVRSQNLEAEKNANKITKKSFTILTSSANNHLAEKRSSSQASRFTKDKFVNMSDSENPTGILTLDINKHLLQNISSSKASNKDKFIKSAEKPRTMIPPNVNMHHILHQTNKGNPSNTKYESVKCSEKRSTSLTNNKKITTEIISTPIKPLQKYNTMAKASKKNVIKQKTITDSPVKGSITSETIPIVPSLMCSQKRKSREQQKQQKIQIHPIEQVRPFHELPFKVEPTKKQFNLKTDLNESPDSDKIPLAVQNHHTQIEQKNLKHAVSHKKKFKKQNTNVDGGIEAGNETTKVTHKNRTSYDKIVGSIAGWDINLGLEPEFIHNQ